MGGLGELAILESTFKSFSSIKSSSPEASFWITEGGTWYCLALWLTSVCWWREFSGWEPSRSSVWDSSWKCEHYKGYLRGNLQSCFPFAIVSN